jgi:hypothetical protein
MNRLTVLVCASIALALGSLPALAEPPIPGYNAPEWYPPGTQYHGGPFEGRSEGRYYYRHRHHGYSPWYRRDEGDEDDEDNQD